MTDTIPEADPDTTEAFDDEALAPLYGLSDAWKEDAQTLRRRGAPRRAETLESAAEDLERRISGWWREPLTAREAAAETGYSPEHLRRLAREKKLPTVGDGGRVRFERRHLPRKPGRRGRGPDASPSIASAVQEARAVVESS